MKRVALDALDTLLIGIWSFLVLFVLGAAFVLLVVPAKWHAQLTTETIFETSLTLFCWLSTSRFLSYMDHSQWITVGLNGAILLLYLWLAPQKTWLHQAAAASAATWFIVLIYVPLHKWVKPYIRIKWGTKASRHAQKIQRQLALQAMVASAASGEEGIKMQ